MKINIGFMQGRLIPSEKKGRIQYFPAKNWEKEIKLAKKNNFNLMEWTIDYDNIKKNPLFNKNLFKKFLHVKKKYKINIPSVTCDFFMQMPFFKLKGKKRKIAISNLFKIIENGSKLKVNIFVIPLVDNSSVKNTKQYKQIISFFNDKHFLKKLGRKNKIVFETDLSPKKNLNFIKNFNKKNFGINYDTGNSASNGFKFNKEKIFFKRVYNIHIKDRPLNGKTVRLGKGDFNFKYFFNFIKKSNYKGNFIMQTARAPRNRHIKEAIINREFIKKFL
tara:strand:+ start:918 stop:1745 length:828 start_codon:yes stop_codon:yes gene_type:complete